MKLVLKCVVSLRAKSEEKLPLDNISLFLLFEIARSYNLFNMTSLSGQNPKRRNTEHRGTEGRTHRRVKTPKSHDTRLRQNIISYCCRVMSYWYIISLLSCHGILIQWNPAGKARNVSLKLQNLAHFCAPSFTNHVYFTPHDRPPLLKGHQFGWPL